MNIILASSILGLTTFAFHSSSSKVVPRAVLSVWPAGRSIYLGDSVSLRCSVAAEDTRLLWTYRWFRHRPHQAPPPDSRHMASGDSYSITGARGEDGGSYWCQGERPGANGSAVLLLSDQVNLMVSGLPSPFLTVTPNSLQFFRGEHFTVQCPGSINNFTDWRLRQLSQDFGERTSDLQAGLCSPLEGIVSMEHPNACLFSSIYSGNSGLYWCESNTLRSNAVNITVSYGTIILKSPYLVSEGDQVVLLCQFWNGNQSMATFFKDGVEVVTQRSPHPEHILGMSIENVTKANEGFYKCASQDRKMESPESWLSVKCNSTWTDWTDVSTDVTWKWILLSSLVVALLFFIPLIVWLVCHNSDRMQSMQSCWPCSKADTPRVDIPKTKQDVTEVQWDLSWMEMSNLMDKQS